jgi:hypothetical protein
MERATKIFEVCLDVTLQSKKNSLKERMHILFSQWAISFQKTSSPSLGLSLP